MQSPTYMYKRLTHDPLLILISCDCGSTATLERLEEHWALESRSTSQLVQCRSGNLGCGLQLSGEIGERSFVHGHPPQYT